MIVTARALMPNEVQVEITVRATLGDLQKSLNSTAHWSRLGELFLEAIRETAENVKKSSETLVETRP